MTKNQLLGFLALGLVIIMGSGCAIKPIAKEYRQQVAAEDVTFSMVLSNPDAYVGDVVLWGGIIIETKNLKNGTNIIVLETPLHGSERPRARGYSRGRFIAQSSKFLDPVIYRPGKKITVAGVVNGKETLPLGKMTYTYPVVSVKQMVLWQPHRRYAYPYYWWDPYWGPYWGWGPGPGYYGDHDEGFEHEHFRNEEREEHEHFGEEERGEHRERGGDRH